MTIFDTRLSHPAKLAAARGLARKRCPYFSAALFSLMPRPMPGMLNTSGAALGVSPGGVMYYDPEVIENDWTLADCEFGLLHEIGHLLRDHAGRCEAGAHDKKIWNMAGDAAINDDLVAAGCVPLSTDILPARIVDPRTDAPMADGLTEEAYYDALRQSASKKPQAGGGGEGEGGQGGDGAGAQKPSKARPGNGNCGGIAGNPMDGLPEESTAGGRSAVEIERVRRQVANDIKAHAEAHGAGSVPGGWSVWAGQQLAAPKIRWQDKLRRALRHGVAKVRGQVDYHFERPSRRQHAMGYGRGTPILPSMFAPVPRVACFVDTSGSMGREDLALAMGEVQGVIRSTGLSVTFGCCDANVHGRIDKVRNVQEACSRLKGGGGTDFRPVFTEIAAMPRAEQPHIVIFATDGDGPAPAIPPAGVIVVWVLVGAHAVVPYSAAGGGRITWGEQIFVKADGATPVTRAA